MAQVGCGSVGLMRTASSAAADRLTARHRAAASPKTTLFMITSLAAYAPQHAQHLLPVKASAVANQQPSSGDPSRRSERTSSQFLEKASVKRRPASSS